MRAWVERTDEEIVSAWETWAKNSLDPDKTIHYNPETRMGYTPMGIAKILRQLLKKGGKNNKWKSHYLWMHFVEAAKEDAQMRNYDIVDKITPKR